MSTVRNVVSVDGTAVDAPYVYQVGPRVPMATEVDSWQRFTLRTLDASGDQVRPGVTADSLDADLLFPVAGPVEISGVRAGDRVGIGILDIRCSPVGHVWTRPGLGFGNPGWFDVRELKIEPPLVLDVAGLELPYTVHAGTLGVLPAMPAPARTLGPYGGNLDIPELGPRSMLWVTAAVDGGGVFAGDVHAAIGDAEVCGTGVETPAELDLVAVRGDWQAANPAVMTEDKVWLLGIGTNFEQALSTVLPDVTAALADHLRVPESQAYLLSSVLLDIRACQIVNPLTSVAVSLRGNLDQCLVPPQAHQLFHQFLDSTVKEH
ncbi:acetamidase/formamidase family protein [Saccharopolyspora pogona]|uniref:acetamidase/formamidase family protein n=1 Tax=Saccharopolyspora pogona TaxID=333966 RepID=UPI0016846A24|nr:acetamidase/formamidase family protein [Saccharopolyspora pogona]